MASGAELPTLYAAAEPVRAPAVDLYARQVSAGDRATLDRLASTAEHGTAGAFLQSVLDRAHREALRDWNRNSGRVTRARASSRTLGQANGNERDGAQEDDEDEDGEDDDALELRERGYVHKRKALPSSPPPPPPRQHRIRSASAASVLSAEGDDELGSETEVAASAGRSRKDKLQSARRRRKRLRENLRVPDVDLEHADLPPDFPSHDMFTALHARAQHLYTSRHNLLPPLYAASPLLPASSQAYFDALHARVNAEEERALRSGSKRLVAAWKRTRINKANAGERRGIWTDANRAFEGSALVALGLLTQLLVDEAVAIEAEQLPVPPPIPA